MQLLRGVGYARSFFPVGTTYQYMVFATLKEINLGISAEDARQTGGDRLFALDILTNSKTGRIRITDAQLMLDVFQLMGSGIAETSGNVLVHEVLTVSGGAVATNAVYVVDAVKGTTVSILSATSANITGFVATDGTNITGLSAYNGTKVRVLYETAACTEIQKFTLSVDDDPIYFELVHVSRYKEPSDNQYRIFQTRIHRCRSVGNLEYTFTHGEFSSPQFEAEVLDPGRSDGAVIEYTHCKQPVGLTQ